MKKWNESGRPYVAGFLPYLDELQNIQNQGASEVESLENVLYPISVEGTIGDPDFLLLAGRLLRLHPAPRLTLRVPAITVWEIEI